MRFGDFRFYLYSIMNRTNLNYQQTTILNGSETTSKTQAKDLHHNPRHIDYVKVTIDLVLF